MNEPQFSAEYLEMVERLDSGDPPETPSKETPSSGSERRLVGRCAECQSWEPDENDGTRRLGYCPTFHKITGFLHGSKCTAFRPANADAMARRRGKTLSLNGRAARRRDLQLVRQNETPTNSDQ